MPPLTRWFVKVALGYLVVALLVGIAVAARSSGYLPPAIASLSPLYFHFLMVGWVTNLIFGIVYWMFPRYSKHKPHGSESLWLITFWFLNLGLVLRVAEPIHTLRPEAIWGWLLGLSALLQWLAGLMFVVNTWGRVKQH